ncbi:MAG TPA: 50S ribosomal protein L16 [Candidatus Paceibacterota bacterium]
MLTPKKVKYRKWHTMRRNAKKGKVETRGITVAFGSHGLKATTHARIRSNQIESARKVVVRSLGKTGRMWLRIFPDMPFTKKPPEVKLGKGKGDPAGYEVDVWPGRVIFEVDGVTDALATKALNNAAKKLPLKAKVVARQH